MFIKYLDDVRRRGGRWLVNQRYYRFAVNTGVTHSDHDQWRHEIEVREKWAEGEPSRTRRQDRTYSSVMDESEWGVVETGDDLQLWWYFMNEHDALLFKLRWC